MSSPTLTVCMIVRNEAKRLPHCLASIEGLWDELVVVDTGSTDYTMLNLGYKLHALGNPHMLGVITEQIPWANSFADARNHALSLATSDWVFIIDADEVLTPQDIKVIKAEIANPDCDAYLIQTRNYLPDLGFSNAILTLDSDIPESVRDCPMFQEHPIAAHMVSWTCRLYRNRPEYRYTGAIHNEIHQSIVKAGGTIAKMALAPVIHHAGYITGDIEAKKARQAATAEIKMTESSDDPQTLWECAAVHHTNGEYSTAITILHQVNVLAPGFAMAYHDLGMSYQCLAVQRSEEDGDPVERKNEKDDLLRLAATAYRTALNLDPTNLQAAINLSNVKRTLGEPHEALALGKHAITFHERDARAWNTYGAMLALLGYPNDAIAAFTRALALDPNHEHARLNLARLSEDATVRPNPTPASCTTRPATVAFFDSLGSFSAPIVQGFKDAGCTVYGPYPRFDASIAADLWYVDWADRNLASASFTKPPGTRLVCHMYSYEAFGKQDGVLWKNVDLLTVCSQHIYEAAKRFAGVPESVPVFIMEQGIDLDAWTFKADRDPKKISWAGYINWKKGPQLLVQTAKHLEPYGYQIHVAGAFQDGRSEMCVMNAINNWGVDNLHLHGWQDDINGWWDEINPAWHLCTSLLEGLPFNVQEAAAKGIQPLVWWYPGAELHWPREWLWQTVSDLTGDDEDFAVYPGLLREAPESTLARCFINEHHNRATNVPKLIEASLGPLVYTQKVAA